MITSDIRWGILGTGAIAASFAEGLAAAPGHRLAAVGSRSVASATTFTQRFPARAHGSYADLCGDPDVDVIYIASPHPGHVEHALLAISHRKAVLIEKPLTLNQAEAERIRAAARAAGVFAMEAMWTRFLPAVRQAKQWIADGLIGEVRQVSAEFGFRAPFDPASRLFDPLLGGGALLDVGIYVVSFAHHILGRPPVRISAQAHRGSTGVDEQTAVLLAWEDGALAHLSCAVRTRLRNEAVIFGTKGRIILPEFWHATTARLQVGDQPEHVVDLPYLGTGLTHEAIAVGECLRAGLTECPVMPLDESVAIMTCLDECRRQTGIRYPGEAPFDLA